jgi:hypothetical protein
VVTPAAVLRVGRSIDLVAAVCAVTRALRSALEADHQAVAVLVPSPMVVALAHGRRPILDGRLVVPVCELRRTMLRWPRGAAVVLDSSRSPATACTVSTEGERIPLRSEASPA